MYRSILLPLDGSEPAEQAIPLAMEIARRAGAVVHPVHVYVPDEAWRDMESITPYQFEHEVSYEGEYQREEQERERRYLEAIARRARDEGVAAEPELLGGRVESALIEHAGRVDADLIVMTTHGRGPVERAWVGSVADRVVRQSPVPVLLVRPAAEATPAEATPAEARPPVLENVLIPLDGSEHAESVLGPATELGKLWGARCTLFTVVRPGGILSRAEPEKQRAEKAKEEAARAYLSQVAARLQGDWAQVDVEIADEWSVGGAIVWTADRLGADAIALSTHGHGGLRRLFLGSVADKVIRGASVPVLVTRPRESS